MQVGQRELRAQQVRPASVHQPIERVEHARRAAQRLGDLGFVAQFAVGHRAHALDRHAPHHRPVGIGIEQADDLVHARALGGIAWLQRRALEGLVDIARDRAGLIELERAVFERRDAAERMAHPVRGRHAVGAEDLDLVQGVGHALLFQRQARHARVHAARQAVQLHGIGHRAQALRAK